MSVPESVLHKKHNSINCHAVREAVAAEIVKVEKEDGDANLADLFTKVVAGEKRWKLCWNTFVQKGARRQGLVQMPGQPTSHD